MRAVHLEIFVEEPSMEVFLEGVLPRLLGDYVSFSIYTHQGKFDLLRKLPGRLRGYAGWLPKDWRLVVLIDRDEADCLSLKKILEKHAITAGLRTRASVSDGRWQVVNRIAVEELEAWFFGHWDAVRAAYPKTSASIPFKAPYRHCDQIVGGTWEAFERIMTKAGYFAGGLRKFELSQKISQYFDHNACNSPSFITSRCAS